VGYLQFQQPLTQFLDKVRVIILQPMVEEENRVVGLVEE
jgi:hypothetical protein